MTPSETITAPTPGDARALGRIKEELLRCGVDVPFVADIHFSTAAQADEALISLIKSNGKWGES